MQIGLGIWLGRSSTAQAPTPASIFGANLSWHSTDDDAARSMNTGTNPQQYASLPNRGTLGGTAAQAVAATQPRLSSTSGRTSSQYLGAQRLASSLAASNFRFLHDGTGCTMAAVFRFDDNSSSPAPFGTGGNALIGTYAFTSGGILTVRIHNGSGYVKSSASPASTIDIGETYVLIVTYTSPNISIRLYDSTGATAWTLDTTEDLTPSASDPTSTLAIGAQRDAATNYMNGVVPEVVLANRSATADEIAALRDYLLSRWATNWVVSGVPWPMFWLDASDASTITIDTGVAGWLSKSGLAIDVDQATTAAQPAYGSDGNGAYVSFDGSDDALDLTGFSLPTGKRTIVMVCTPNIPGAGGFYAIDSGTGRFIIKPNDTLNGVGHYDGAWKYSAAGANVHQCLAIQLDHATLSSHRRDGSSLGTVTYTDVAIGGTSSIGSAFAGSGNHYTGLIREILIFQPALTLTQLQNVEAHLSTKWGTP